MPRIDVNRAADADFAELAVAFGSWPKPPELFHAYRAGHDAEEIEVLVARVGGGIAGYCLVKWASDYPPFATAGIPEIVDLNVLHAQRGLGAGLRLLLAAEEVAGTRSATIGLLVGLYSDYGAAQRMYVRHGYVPDGRGTSIAGRVVKPGATIVLDDDAVLAFTKSVKPSASTY